VDDGDFKNGKETRPTRLVDKRWFLKPSPPFQTDDRISVYKKRVNQKSWKSTWNKLVIHHILDE
jgi:hypothetical protein